MQKSERFFQIEFYGREFNGFFDECPSAKSTRAFFSRTGRCFSRRGRLVSRGGKQSWVNLRVDFSRKDAKFAEDEGS